MNNINMDLMFEKKCAEGKIVKKCGEGFLKTVSNYAQGIELNECKTDDIKKLAEENDVKTEYSDFSSDVVRYLVAKRFIDTEKRFVDRWIFNDYLNLMSELLIERVA